MKSTLRLLILEDNSDDAVLIQRTLQRAEFILETKVVSDRQEFVAALHSFSPQLVLSDHSLPQFSSIDALELFRNVFPFIPFILVTGAVSEEFAASMIKAGADDYVLKNNLKRLPTAIVQAMERRQVQESLLQSETNLRTIFENTDTAYILLDSEFNIRSFNLLAAQWTLNDLGFALQEGGNFISHPQMDGRKNIKELMKKVLSGTSAEYETSTKDPQPKWYHVRIRPIRNTDGKVQGLCIAVSDISERKKEEEAKKKAELDFQASHERLLFHIENTPLGFIEWDSELRIKSWSKRAVEIFGWTEEQVFDKQLINETYIHEDDLPWVLKVSRELLDGTITRNNIQHRNYTKDHKVVWCEWFNSVSRNKDGEVITIMSLVQDITERKTIEDILLEYNDRYEILSKATNDAIWDCDINHDFELWNHGIQTIFGYQEREITSSKKWWQEKIHPTDFERVQREINEAFQSKATNWVSRYQFKCADGSFKHVLDRAYIIYDTDEKPFRMIGAMQDVTEQKKSIEEIEKLSLVASKTISGVIITDPEDRIEWVNEAFISMTGFTMSEVIGKKPGHFLQGPETDLATVRRIGAKLKALEPVTEEIINYSRTGRKYWLRMSISPVFDDEHHVKHFIAIETDITQQKEFERNITSIARELSGLIENANAPIFGTDRNGYINEWNTVTADLTGYSKNEVLGKRLLDTFIKESHRQSIMVILDNVFNDQPASNLEIPIITKTKADLIFLLNINPRKNSAQEITGILMVGQDITELIEYRRDLEAKVRERTRELNDALHKEKELVEMKSKFVSIASHEFRTPLSTISLASAILKKHKDKISGVEFDARIDTIEKQVRHMTYLLDDILIIGKADAGKIHTQYTSVPMPVFFQQIATEVEQNSGTHRVNFLSRCTENNFACDEKLLRNITVNLLTNAIKFSPTRDSISMSLSNTSSYLTIEVSDKGIGITGEDLKNIFASFHRGSNVGAIPGTGLGLSIVKKAVDLLMGDIKIQSKVTMGTTITVLLPLQPLNKN